MSRPFEEFWELLLTELDKETAVHVIRSWSAYTDHYLDGQFAMFSFRSWPEWVADFQAKIDFPKVRPFDVVACTRMEGRGFAYLTKQDFDEHYHKWPHYRNGTTRKDFGNSRNSTYLIAILKEFEQLMNEAFVTTR